MFTSTAFQSRLLPLVVSALWVTTSGPDVLVTSNGWLRERVLATLVLLLYSDVLTFEVAAFTTDAICIDKARFPEVLPIITAQISFKDLTFFS